MQQKVGTVVRIHLPLTGRTSEKIGAFCGGRRQVPDGGF
jgi:hypothetical protein